MAIWTTTGKTLNVLNHLTPKTSKTKCRKFTIGDGKHPAGEIIGILSHENNQESI